MAKLTWLGEDTPEAAGPSFTTAFGGIKFPKGEAVEVADADTIARARRNPFFEVADDADAPAPQPAPTSSAHAVHEADDTPHRRKPGRPAKAAGDVED